MRYLRSPVLLLAWSCLYVLFCEASLDKTLHHYDTLHHRDLRHHHVTRRSTKGGKFLNDRLVSFDTLGRHFELHLTTNKKLFSPDFVAVELYDENGGPESAQIPLDQDGFYEGYLSDEPSSSVHAYYEHENMVINIKTKEDTFVVEPSWRHLKDSEEYTMIAYRASDIKTDKEKHPGQHSSQSFCGYVREGIDTSNDTHNPIVDSEESPGYTYDRKSSQSRYRRQTSTLRVCPVILVADYHFFQGVGDSDTMSTSKYLAGVLSRVDDIYRRTDFGNGYTDMGFEIKEIRVYSGPTTNPAFNADQSHWDTEALLRSFGQEDWSSYCLAHLFTYLNFNGGVQGLAWIASSVSNEVGGICSQVYQGTHYNTAWTSNLNSYNQRILSQEADLVTAHEFGHNWGSPHDPSECAPSTASGGKYVMYQYSVSGYDNNNNDFSRCSVSSIGSVLQGKSSRCFTERGSATCGNNVVEDGEQCDAGSNGLQGFDSCCTRTCTLSTGSECSDVNSACCSGCQYSPIHTTCRQGSTTTCDAAANCTGMSSECPDAKFRDNGASCLDMGECTDGTCYPLCESNGLISCSCDVADTACFYCCKTASTECTPYLDPVTADQSQLPNGRSCYAGVCDQGECVPSTSKNTARLWDIIKNLDGNAILEWMRNNIVITVIVISLVIYIPFCIAVWCIDRKNKKQDEKEVDWLSRDNDNLVRDGDTRRVRRANPRRRQPYERIDSGGASASGIHVSH